MQIPWTRRRQKGPARSPLRRRAHHRRAHHRRVHQRDGRLLTGPLKIPWQNSDQTLPPHLSGGVMARRLRTWQDTCRPQLELPPMPTADAQADPSHASPLDTTPLDAAGAALARHGLCDLHIDTWIPRRLWGYNPAQRHGLGVLRGRR